MNASHTWEQVSASPMLQTAAGPMQSTGAQPEGSFSQISLIQNVVQLSTGEQAPLQSSSSSSTLLGSRSQIEISSDGLASLAVQQQSITSSMVVACGPPQQQSSPSVPAHTACLSAPFSMEGGHANPATAWRLKVVGVPGAHSTALSRCWFLLDLAMRAGVGNYACCPTWSTSANDGLYTETYLD